MGKLAFSYSIPKLVAHRITRGIIHAEGRSDLEIRRQVTTHIDLLIKFDDDLEFLPDPLVSGSRELQPRSLFN